MFAPLRITECVTGFDWPLITTGLKMLGSCVNGIIELFAPILKLIVLAPEAALTSSIACRNEPGPLSFVFVTVNVVGTRRSSSDSSTGRSRSFVHDFGEQDFLDWMRFRSERNMGRPLRTRRSVRKTRSLRTGAVR